jgi:hypothetical protein
MSLEGRINVDVLFHDKDGTASLKVVSLQDSRGYTSGKVAVITGAAGTSSVQIQSYFENPTYRDSSGELVQFLEVNRVLFSWSGSNIRTLTDAEYGSATLKSKQNYIALTDFVPADQFVPVISSGSGTGTYTILLYGT